MSFVEATLETIARARSDTDLYAVSQGLLMHATPAEFNALAESPLPAGSFADWLRGVHASVFMHRSMPSRFERRPLSRGNSIYSAGAGAGALVIAFCGNVQLLCAPTALILQYFPEEAFDVLVVRDPSRKGYSAGSPGYADSFPGLVEKLGREAMAGGYREIRCFGASSGGAAALAAGLMLDASRYASFCGQPPTLSTSYGRLPASIEMENCLKASKAGPGRGTAIFGAGNPKDAGNAQALARLIDVTLMPIGGLVDHNVITPLHKRGDLRATFQAVGLL